MPSELVAARSFAFKRQKRPLLSYLSLSPVALDNLINLLMFPLKALQGV